MIREGEVRGAMVVQTYLPDIRYTGADKALLAFVAEHVLTALERKQLIKSRYPMGCILTAAGAAASGGS